MGMPQEFYDNFENQANALYSDIQKFECYLRGILAVINFILNFTILFVILRNRQGNFRRETHIFMAGMVVGQSFIGVVILTATANAIVGHFYGGYSNCISGWIFSAVSAALSILFSNIIIMEQGWTIILRKSQWDKLVTGLLFAGVISISIIFASLPFWHESIIGYPVLSPSNTYCVTIIPRLFLHITQSKLTIYSNASIYEKFMNLTDPRPITQIGGYIVFTIVLSAPLLVISFNGRVWYMLYHAQKQLQITARPSSSSPPLSDRDARMQNDAKYIVSKRAIITSLANICGWTLFACKAIYELTTHRFVPAWYDELTVLLVIFHLSIVSPVLLIVFDVNIRKEVMEIFGLTTNQEGVPVIRFKPSVKRQLKAHHEWSMTMTKTNV